MDLLTFARGPILGVSVAICLFGVVWRIVGTILLRGRPTLSRPRDRAAWKGVRVMMTRSVPKPAFRRGIMLEMISYAFHIGLFASLLLYLPHILFFQAIIRGLIGYDLTALTGIPWPALPAGIVSFFSALAIVGLLIAIGHRLFSPVKRLISTADDYISWAATILPLITGMAAYAEIGLRYETLLALHFLSVEFLLIWFPFGKLFHPFTMFTMRAVTGVLFARKGAAT